ncbi:hypothetical protein AB0383_16715 [Amycolatopsis sp. NPDC051373]|uniref:hypothetical protein n=1 Tax=Amycolatopsis sp. NPDC051373 TaxID=3155801 RepID=UPI00345109DE
MQDKGRPTRADIAAAVPEWTKYTGPAGLKGEYGETADLGGPLWITRVPSKEREGGYAYTIYDAAAWQAFSAALTRASGWELLHA